MLLPPKYLLNMFSSSQLSLFSKKFSENLFNEINEINSSMKLPVYHGAQSAHLWVRLQQTKFMSGSCFVWPTLLNVNVFACSDFGDFFLQKKVFKTIS